MIELSSNPRRTALAIALLADALQIVFFPVFVEGAFSPLDDLLDIAVAWALIRLLGWHWAFLPSFVAKVVPGVDLVPTWTMAVPSGHAGDTPRAGPILGFFLLPRERPALWRRQGGF